MEKNQDAKAMVEQILGSKFRNYIIMVELPDGRTISSVRGNEDDMALMIHMHMQNAKSEEFKKLAEAMFKVLYVSRFLETVVSIEGKKMRIRMEEVK